MLELLPPLNDKNLPWLDVIHPIVVHFVIAMALISAEARKKPNLDSINALIADLTMAHATTF